MSEIEELRSVKDQAQKAIAKKQYEKAAALYLEIAERDPDADWYQRAGDAFRRAGKNAQAIAAFSTAARGYAQEGFLLKAIAVGKTILQLDPKHTATQSMLTDLYARHSKASGPAPTAAPAKLASSPFWPKVATPTDEPVYPSGYPLVATPPDSAPPPVYPAPPVRTPTPAYKASSGSIPIIAIDAILEARADSPIDALPLRSVLSHRLSGQFATIDLAARLDAKAKPAAAPPSAYEISLDGDDLDFEVNLAPLPLKPLTPQPKELDFSDLNDLPHVTKAALPQIPLFSSLAEEELRTLIDRMPLQQYEPGEVVIRQGDPGGPLFVVVDGEVAVTSTAPGATPRELARLAGGAFFGEVGLLTDDPRSATVAATRTTRVLEISRELAWEITRRSPDVLRTLMRFFRDRMLDRLIGSSQLFSVLSPSDARSLAGHFVFLELEAGMVAIKQGERSPGLFFLTCGAAEAVRDGHRIGLLGPGDVFGEMSLLLRTPATADVRMLRKCWALELPQARFQEIMMQYPQVLAYVSELGEERRQKMIEADDTAPYSRIEIV